MTAHIATQGNIFNITGKSSVPKSERPRSTPTPAPAPANTSQADGRFSQANTA